MYDYLFEMYTGYCMPAPRIRLLGQAPSALSSQHRKDVRLEISLEPPGGARFATTQARCATGRCFSRAPNSPLGETIGGAIGAGGRFLANKFRCATLAANGDACLVCRAATAVNAALMNVPSGRSSNPSGIGAGLAQRIGSSAPYCPITRGAEPSAECMNCRRPQRSPDRLRRQIFIARLKYAARMI